MYKKKLIGTSEMQVLSEVEIAEVGGALGPGAVAVVVVVAVLASAATIGFAVGMYVAYELSQKEPPPPAPRDETTSRSE